jgi:hypothetical protein
MHATRNSWIQINARVGLLFLIVEREVTCPIRLSAVPNRKPEAHEVSAASIPTAPGAAKRIAAGQR